MEDAQTLVDFSDPVGSEERLRVALSAEADPTRTTVLSTQLARMLGLQGRYAEAHSELDSLRDDDPESRVRIALERGRVHRTAGEPQAAESHLSSAATWAAEAQLEGLRLDALHMLALVPEDVDEQRHRHQAALHEARASTDPDARRWIGPLLHNLGLVEHDAGDLEAALSTLEAAVEVRAGQADAEELRVSRWMVAWTKRLMGRVDEALVEQQQLERESLEGGTPDPYVHDELAELYLAVDNPTLAQHHRDQATKLRQN